MSNLYLVLISFVAYLVGSFPTAYLVVKKITGQDIKKVGSGNIGAMNTVRALKNFGKGKLAVIGFLVVLIIDMAKGALAVFLAQKWQFLDYNMTLAVIFAAFFVVLGHNYSIFLKFSGGRGAACLIGILLYLNILSLLVWGLPVILASILAQIILEKTGFEKKINWKKISEIFKILGSQMAGRMVGLIIAPIPLYFYDPKAFLPIAAGTILLLIKNIPRFKGYFLKEKIYGE
ncbi:glycerol-3-phosphate acyltransferase [Patescibacteria group bacterium]|nr:glycerol-3-phosphate acyltransferase [Patescibacteria group bacterium]